MSRCGASRCPYVQRRAGASFFCRLFGFFAVVWRRCYIERDVACDCDTVVIARSVERRHVHRHEGRAFLVQFIRLMLARLRHVSRLLQMIGPGERDGFCGLRLVR